MNPRHNFARTIRKWWQTWAVLDLCICGIAILATAVYVVYRPSLGPNTSSGWIDLWPNITTEVLGAWLSVRIIDHLLTRRSNKSRGRWRQAEILMYWRDVASQLGRYGEEREAQILADELCFYDEPHNVSIRLNHLDDSEQGDVEAARKAVQALLDDRVTFQRVRADRETVGFDDPRREHLDAEEKRLRGILRERAGTVAEAVLKARANILNEEFELE